MFKLRPRLERLCAGAAAAMLGLAAGGVAAQPIAVTDVLGRSVTLEGPVDEIVLGLYFEDFWAVGGADAYDKVVGFSRAAWEDWRPANWQAYLEVRPDLAEIADVGEVEAQTFSAERVIALQPDVLILAQYQYTALGPDIGRMENAGVPVVVIDFHSQSLDRYLDSIRILGLILGTEDRAVAIAAEYEGAIEEVRRRVAEAAEPAPRVYVELGNQGPAGQGITYGNGYMWGAIATIAGGDNIADGLVERWAPLTAEQVIASRPEIIVIAGSEWRDNATAQLVGHGIAEAEVDARLQGFLDRPGWQTLPAVETGDVHAVYHGASRTILDFVMVQYFAKILHPDLFRDLDPAANYLTFYQKYLPITPVGTFMHRLD